MDSAEKKPIQRSLAETIGVILNNAIPVAGILFLGWEVAPILFLYWLDGELCIIELMGVVMVEVSREEEGLFPKKIKGIKLIIYYIITFIFAALIASMPAFLAGWIIYAILDDYASSPFEIIFAQKTLWIGIGLNIAIRGYNVIKSIINPRQESVKFTAEEKYTLFAYRFFIIYFLASYFFKSGGTIMIYLFVIFVAALFTYSELRPERLLHIAGYYAAKQKKN